MKTALASVALTGTVAALEIIRLGVNDERVTDDEAYDFVRKCFRGNQCCDFGECCPEEYTCFESARVSYLYNLELDCWMDNPRCCWKGDCCPMTYDLDCRSDYMPDPMSFPSE